MTDDPAAAPASRKRRGNPRWASPLAYPYAVPSGPSRWEQLTQGRDEDEVIEALLAGREKELLRWIRGHYLNSAYVPTRVLQRLGIEGGDMGD